VAAIVSVGPAAAPPAESASEGAGAASRELEPLLAWSAASTQLLLDALREAGPDRVNCWTWWGPSESPQTSGAVARHQLQEVIVRQDGQPEAVIATVQACGHPRQCHIARPKAMMPTVRRLTPPLIADQLPEGGLMADRIRSESSFAAVAQAQLAEEESVPICCLVNRLVE
jgi:hypothetical protein